MIALPKGLTAGAAAGMRLDNWRVERPEQRRVLSEVGDWYFAWLYGQLTPGQEWLYLHGPFGVGKTHIAVGLLYEMVMGSTWAPGVAVLNWATHIEQALEQMNSGRNDADREIAAAREADVLLLDDLDKADGSRFTLRRLYGLIDARLMAGRTTLITANRPMADLLTHWVTTARAEERAQVADRAGAVVERLAQCCQELAFTGRSYRLG
jgi:DNA replication protein DnaC